MAMQALCSGCGVIIGQIDDMSLERSHLSKTHYYKDVKHAKDCPIAHPEYETVEFFKNLK